ncbi:DUF4286 family protein [Raineya sp.]|jgi:hypothetical protein
MIVYNVTVNIDKNIHEEWLNWMLNQHIPDVMRTGCFLENKIMRLLTETENDGFTYAFQYICASMQDLERYQKEFAPKLQAEHSERYKDKFVAFRSILEIVQ